MARENNGSEHLPGAQGHAMSLKHEFHLKGYLSLSVTEHCRKLISKTSLLQCPKSSLCMHPCGPLASTAEAL